MISVIMAHYRREELLYKTLWGYRHTRTPEELEDIEFVIIDDDGGRSKTFWKVVGLHRSALKITAAAMDEKTHNTSGPMNFGIKLATGDLFVLTNPENIPVTPHLLTKLKGYMDGKPNRHFSGACYSLNKTDSDAFTLDIDKKEEFLRSVSKINVVNRKFGNNGSHSGWRQHSKYFPGKLFFLSAMWRAPLFALRGFDEDYMKGQSREDVDLVWRATKMKMEFFHTDSLVVYHQFHFGPGCHKLKPERAAKVAINVAIFNSKRKLKLVARNVGREWGKPKSARRVEKWFEIRKPASIGTSITENPVTAVQISSE